MDSCGYNVVEPREGEVVTTPLAKGPELPPRLKPHNETTFLTPIRRAPPPVYYNVVKEGVAVEMEDSVDSMDMCGVYGCVNDSVDVTVFNSASEYVDEKSEESATVININGGNSVFLSSLKLSPASRNILEAAARGEFSSPMLARAEGGASLPSISVGDKTTIEVTPPRFTSTPAPPLIHAPVLPRKSRVWLKDLNCIPGTGIYWRNRDHINRMLKWFISGSLYEVKVNNSYTHLCYICRGSEGYHRVRRWRRWRRRRGRLDPFSGGPVATGSRVPGK